MSQYAVDLHCRCGEVHSIAQILIDNGPDQAGTVAELWPSGKLPTVVACKLHDAVWCDQAGE